MADCSRALSIVAAITALNEDDEGNFVDIENLLDVLKDELDTIQREHELEIACLKVGLKEAREEVQAMEDRLGKTSFVDLNSSDR